MSQHLINGLRPRGCACDPVDAPDWVIRMAKRLGMEHTLREGGRPKKGE